MYERVHFDDVNGEIKQSFHSSEIYFFFLFFRSDESDQSDPHLRHIIIELSFAIKFFQLNFSALKNINPFYFIYAGIHEQVSTFGQACLRSKTVLVPETIE